MYFIRFASWVDIRNREHAKTLGRFRTWQEAFDAMTEREEYDPPVLEVVGPR